jgi:hypothetical protein
MTTTKGVNAIVWVIFATALMASSSYVASSSLTCKPVSSLEKLLAVNPAGKNLTEGPLGLYAIVSKSECYYLLNRVVDVNLPGFGQKYDDPIYCNPSNPICPPAWECGCDLAGSCFCDWW